MNRNNDKYLYFLNYTDNLKTLCDLEMKSIFGFIPENKYFMDLEYINPSRSIFIKGCLVVSYMENSLDELSMVIKKAKLFYDKYKIRFIKVDAEVKYKDRLVALRKIGFSIEGEFALHNPQFDLAITKINQKWIFGQYIKNDGSWISRRQKPFNYSYALDNIFAKTLINIAIENNSNLSVVDPCCGVGTVVIEGRNAGVNIKGYDLNSNVVDKCNQNLRFFGYEADIEIKNICDIETQFDVAIVDLPYGKFSNTSVSEQTFIVKNTKKIAKKAIFVSMIEMKNLYKSCGFTIIDSCFVKKRDKFRRYVAVCV